MLPRMQASLEAAEACLRQVYPQIEVEVVIVTDEESKGPAWARNRGLDRISGDYVFFADSDDEVLERFLLRPFEILEKSGADFCIFTFKGAPSFPASVYVGPEAVKGALLPAYFGYSFDDVRRMYSGGTLSAKKDLGSVCRCAFRRSFLEKFSIRFCERLMLHEDAAFLSSCAARATKVVRIEDELYRYDVRPSGFDTSGIRSDRRWRYKFDILEFRKRLECEVPGVWRYCEASCVFALFEFLRGFRLIRFFRYLLDPAVRKAVRDFPWSVTKLLSLAINR